MSLHNHKQKGAVSLFVVIFSALLITIITVGFIRLMIQSQMQATANDLSQSALDSAQAGAEDAKRAIVRYYSEGCPVSGNALCDAVDSGKCSTIQDSGLLGTGLDDSDGVRIKTDNTDNQLNQAYTCVKITLNTPDYVASLNKNTARFIRLQSDKPFTKVVVQWYSQQDFEKAKQASGSVSASIGSDLGSDTGLPAQSSWLALRPALMRLQLLQYTKGKPFTMADLNGRTDNSSLFLIPSQAGLSSTQFDTSQPASTPVLTPVTCDSSFPTGSAGQYACSAEITLPNPVSGDKTNRQAYLQVGAFYQNVTFRICLDTCTNFNDPAHPNFKGVQPVIDSTGRAGDYFRRVQSRVEFMGKGLPEIDAAVDLTGSLCKSFGVSNNVGEYEPGGCNPSL